MNGVFLQTVMLEISSRAPLLQAVQDAGNNLVRKHLKHLHVAGCSLAKLH